MQAVSIYGVDAFRRWDGRKFHGSAVDVGLWDTIMLTLQGYNKVDLQPHADALQAELLRLKANAELTSKLSKGNTEDRVRSCKPA